MSGPMHTINRESLQNEDTLMGFLDMISTMLGLGFVTNSTDPLGRSAFLIDVAASKWGILQEVT